MTSADNTLSQSLIVRQLDQMDYVTVWQAMKEFTDQRDESTIDELWLVEHPAVFTLGQASKEEHLLMPGDIPVVQADRGGQVTYHGPGQQVMYFLINLKRRKLGVRALVTLIENGIINTLADFGVTAYAKPDAPGVYVDEKKIASLGLRVRKGCSFHGLALNVAMDMEPFLRINPCGYAGLEMVQSAAISSLTSVEQAGKSLTEHMASLLSAAPIEYQHGLESLHDH